jgi:tRNA modification GTPase
MPALIAALNARVQENFGLAERPALTRTRHRNALQEAGVALERGLERASSGTELELVAEDLRLAMREIGRITGAVDVESLLDIVFRDFCIGK